MSLAALNKALELLEEHGLLLLSDSRFPSVTMIVSESPVTGSWWSHPKANVIFEVAESLSEHADVVATKLVSGKVSFVYRGLWPALIAAGTSREPWQLQDLSGSALRMLDYVTKKGTVRTDEIPPGLRPTRESVGDAARELERRLLVQSEEIHTESGAHAKVLQTWARWARRARAPKPRTSAEAAKQELEGVVGRINAKFDANARLPWT